MWNDWVSSELPFSDLLATTIVHLSWNESPVLAMLRDQLQHDIVLFLRPWSSNLRRLDSAPSLRALRRVSIRHFVRYRWPFPVVLAVIESQHAIFLFRPGFRGSLRCLFTLSRSFRCLWSISMSDWRFVCEFSWWRRTRSDLFLYSFFKSEIIRLLLGRTTTRSHSHTFNHFGITDKFDGEGGLFIDSCISDYLPSSLPAFPTINSNNPSTDWLAHPHLTRFCLFVWLPV